MATSTLHNEQEEHPCSRMTAFVIRNCPRNDEPELWGITNSWVPGRDIDYFYYYWTVQNSIYLSVLMYVILL